MRATGNGVLVQVSIKAIKEMGNVHINVKFNFVVIIFVAIQEQLVLKNLNVFCRLCFTACKLQSPCYIFITACLPLPYLLHYFTFISSF
jgi:hypothetical protein